MIVRVIDGVEGNVGADPDLAAARDRHRERGTLERLQIDDTQRRRSRFRASTDAGRELGVVARGTEPLAPGDVLLEEAVMIVVELAEIPTLAVRFSADTDPTTAAVVGHAAGNRHWDLAVDSGTVHVPAGSDPDARRETLEEILPESAAIERAAVSPSAFDEAAGRQNAGHDVDHTHHDDDPAHHDDPVYDDESDHDNDTVHDDSESDRCDGNVDRYDDATEEVSQDD